MHPGTIGAMFYLWENHIVMRYSYLLSLLTLCIGLAEAQSAADWKYVPGPNAFIKQVIQQDNWLYVLSERRLAVLELTVPEHSVWREVKLPNILTTASIELDGSGSVVVKGLTGSGSSGTASGYLRRHTYRYHPETDQLTDLGGSNITYNTWPSGIDRFEPTSLTLPHPFQIYRYDGYNSSSLDRTELLQTNGVGDTLCLATVSGSSARAEVLDDGNGILIMQRYAGSDSVQTARFLPDECDFIDDELPITHTARLLALYGTNSHQILLDRRDPDTLFARALDGPWTTVTLPTSEAFGAPNGTPFQMHNGNFHLASNRGLYRISPVTPDNLIPLFVVSEPGEAVEYVERLDESTWMVVTTFRSYRILNNGLVVEPLPKLPLGRGVVLGGVFGSKELVWYTGGAQLLNSDGSLEPCTLCEEGYELVVPHPVHPVLERDSVRYLYNEASQTLQVLPDHPLVYDFQFDGSTFIHRISTFSYARSEDWGTTWDTVQTQIPLVNVQWQDDLVLSHQYLGSGAYAVFRSFDGGLTVHSDTITPQYTTYPLLAGLRQHPDGQVLFLEPAGVRVSDDFGQTFSPPYLGNEIPPHNVHLNAGSIPATLQFQQENFLLLHALGGMMVSSDFGFSFHKLAAPFYVTYSSVSSPSVPTFFKVKSYHGSSYQIQGDYLYAGTIFGLYRIHLTDLNYQSLSSPRARIRGHLYEDADENCVYSDQENGLAHLPVALSNGDTTYTDDDGYFELRPYPGEITISIPANAAGFDLSCSSAALNLTLHVGNELHLDFPYTEDHLFTPPSPTDASASPSMIAPNPATDQLQIPGSWRGKRVQMVDSYGRVHLDQRVSSELDVSALSRGIYWVKCAEEIVRVVLK